MASGFSADCASRLRFGQGVLGVLGGALLVFFFADAAFKRFTAFCLEARPPSASGSADSGVPLMHIVGANSPLEVPFDGPAASTCFFIHMGEWKKCMLV